MHIHLLLGLLGSAVCQTPLMLKFEYGRGLWVQLGPERLFLTPDYLTGNNRLFMIDSGIPISPYFFPIPNSRLPVENHRVIAPLTVAGQVIPESVFTVTGTETDGGISEADKRHMTDSQGRLALGPQSQIAQSKIIKIQEIDFVFSDGMTQVGPSLEILDSAPEALGKDRVLNIAGRNDGWFIQVQLDINGKKIDERIMDVSLDAALNDILIPNSMLRSVLKQIQRSNSGAMIDPYGGIMYPCDVEGRFQHPLPRVSLVRSSVHIKIKFPSHAYQKNIVFDPLWKKYMCQTVFRVNMDDAKVSIGGLEDGLLRINPFLIENLSAIFLDGRTRQIVLRERTDPLPRIPVEGIPIFPSCNKVGLHRIVGSKNGFLGFPLTPYSNEDTAEPRYTLSSRFPTKSGDSYDLLFIGHRNGDFPVKTQVLKTLFEIPSDDFVVSRDYERGLFKLPLIIVSDDEDRTGRSLYKVTITKTPEMMMILINPVSNRPETVV
jgi:hypothetical protein